MDEFFKNLLPANRSAFERRLINVALGILLGLVLAGGVTMWQIHKDKARVAEMREASMHPEPTKLGGPFTLTDQDGKTVTDADYRGKFLLVYFGYTFCPDMCPTGLTSIAKSLDQLGDEAAKVKPLFITIDPARDTPKVLKNYVGSFNPSIAGLSGTAEQTAAVAKEYQVYYAREDMDDDSSEYMMDHSSLIYLMDTQGKYISSFPEDVAAATLTKALRDAMAGEPPPPSAPAVLYSPPAKP